MLCLNGLVLFGSNNNNCQTALLLYINPLLLLTYDVQMSHAGAVQVVCTMWMLR